MHGREAYRNHPPGDAAPQLAVWSGHNVRWRRAGCGGHFRMLMTAAQPPVGGSFLIQDQSPSDVFTPEDLSSEHLAIRRAVREFFDSEVAPYIDAIVNGDHNLA